MKITVKSLKGGSSLIEITEKTSILEVKKLVEKDINIPAPQQTLVLFGKTLQDDKLVEDYPKIKDGTKLYVAIKKPESLNTVLNRFLRKYYSEDQCKLIVDEFMRNFQSKVDTLSLDDLERIAKSELGE
ncbi:ubiquitin-like protein 4A [Anoplophora glabripennis]|nr:ubiquitin-like protein 4A [Anoplophora glabripennis]